MVVVSPTFVEAAGNCVMLVVWPAAVGAAVICVVMVSPLVVGIAGT